MKTSLASASWPEQGHTFLNLLNVYRSKELFCDCVLACERRVFHAHKIVLSMCSEFFETILASTPDKNPVIILKEVEAWELECLLNYMYNGETTVPDALFPSLCRVAKYLQVKGFDMVELHRNAVKISNLKQSQTLFRLKDDIDPISCSMAKRKFPYIPDREVLSHSANDSQLGHQTWNRYDQNNYKGSKFIEDRHVSPTVSPNSPFKKRSITGLNQDCEENIPMKKINEANYSEMEKQSVLNSTLETPSFSSPNRQIATTSVIPTSKCSYKMDNLFRPILKEQRVIKKESKVEEIKCLGLTQHAPSGFSDKRTFISQDLGEITDIPSLKRGPPPLLRMDIGNHLNKNQEFDENVKVDQIEEDLSKKKSPFNFEKPVYRENESTLHSGRSSSYPETQINSPSSSHQSLESGNSFERRSIESNTEECSSNSIDYPQISLTSRPDYPMLNQQRDPLLKKIETNKRKRVRGPRSWEFLLRLLKDETSNPSQIKWEDEDNGIFRLIQPDLIALRWGRRTAKNGNDTLSYDSFARGLRYHYATGALNAVSEKSFVYQFGPKANKCLKN